MTAGMETLIAVVAMARDLGAVGMVVGLRFLQSGAALVSNGVADDLRRAKEATIGGLEERRSKTKSETAVNYAKAEKLRAATKRVNAAEAELIGVPADLDESRANLERAVSRLRQDGGAMLVNVERLSARIAELEAATASGQAAQDVTVQVNGVEATASLGGVWVSATGTVTNPTPHSAAPAAARSDVIVPGG